MQNARELDQEKFKQYPIGYEPPKMKVLQQNQSGIVMGMKGIDITKQIITKDAEQKFSWGRMMSLAEQVAKDNIAGDIKEKIFHWCAQEAGIDATDKNLITSRKSIKHYYNYRRNGDRVLRKNSPINLPYAATRMCIIYLCLKYTKMNLSQVGKWLNPKKPFHHSTILHARNTIHNKFQIRDLFVTKIISAVNQKIENYLA